MYSKSDQCFDSDKNFFIARWAMIRRAILRRDDYKCICGLPAGEVHHIIERSVCPKKIRDEYKNLVSVCRRCHSELHGKNGKSLKSKIIKYMANKYGYEYSEGIFTRFTEEMGE